MVASPQPASVSPGEIIVAPPCPSQLPVCPSSGRNHPADTGRTADRSLCVQVGSGFPVPVWNSGRERDGWVQHAQQEQTLVMQIVRAFVGKPALRSRRTPSSSGRTRLAGVPVRHTDPTSALLPPRWDVSKSACGFLQPAGNATAQSGSGKWGFLAATGITLARSVFIQSARPDLLSLRRLIPTQGSVTSEMKWSS